MVADPEGSSVIDDDPQPASARCPRCGYDLRGLVATWEDCCPLEGVCSECGLALRWAEVLVPEKFEPLWCVECAPGWRSVPRAAWRTLIRSFWPWRFWSRLRMSLRIRRGRLAMYVCLLLLPLVFGYLAVQSVAAARLRFEVEQEWAARQGQMQQLIAQCQRELQDPRADAATRAALQQTIQQVQSYLTQGYKISHSYWNAIVEAVLHPRRAVSAGTITTGGRIVQYPAPIKLHSMLYRYLGSSRWSRSFGEWLADARWSLGTFAWIYVFLPAAFVLLPISRRRAKVRFGHIVRVACYGLFIPVTIVFAVQILIAVAYGLPNFLHTCAELVDFLVFLPPLAMLAVWWAVAIKRYLEIPHGPLVVLTLGAISFLLGLAVIWLAWPDLALDLLDLHEVRLGL
jgi:hypothetical protein